ncbi:MAG: hypothetical protein H8F28_03495 [Fibrella sp.]|nr:hypothetical protein [Armatimonadota bacterium]
MLGFTSDNPDLSCPSCHRPMVNMTDYYESLGTGVGIGIGSDSNMIVGYGMRRTINPFAVGELLGSLIDNVLNMGRDKKGAKLCREILPNFPKSQICTECLYIYRNK